MGKTLSTWVMLSIFGWFGWNYAAPNLFSWAGHHPQGILICGGVAAFVMIALVLTGKNK